jgi:aminopeptidase N
MCQHNVRIAVLALALLTGLGATAVHATADDWPVVHHETRLVFDVPANAVQIVDEITIPAGLDTYTLNHGMVLTGGGWQDGDLWRKIPSLSHRQAVLADTTVIDTLRLPEQFLQRPGPKTITLEFGGRFLQSTANVRFSRENVGGEIAATIGDEGIFLASSAQWLPTFAKAMTSYHLTVETPAGVIPMTMGTQISQEEKKGRLITVWDAPWPSDGIDLVANRFSVTGAKHGPVMIWTYLLSDDAKLSDLYIERTRAYLDMYSQMIGPYPYGSFATVENWFPTGYGMPGWTLLGGVVLRLPFIPYTSFGHEICHNWWGNSVYVGEGGNWCEGLTVYCADYHYKEEESAEAAREYRRNLLKDYAAYVKDDANDFPLIEFEVRHSGATRAVGYGKGMMIFHMVDRMIGHDAFLAALRKAYADHRFRGATWSDFFAIFADVSGQDFSYFQEQWIERTGAPVLELKEARREGDDVHFKLRQGLPVYELQVPVVITTAAGAVEHVVWLQQQEEEFVLGAPGAIRVAVDPDFQLFRRLNRDEIEPTVSQVLGEDVPLFILPNGTEAEVTAAQDFAIQFSENATPMMIPGGHPPADVTYGTAVSSVLINPSPEVLKEWLPSGITVSGDLLFMEGRRTSLKEYDAVLAVADPYDPTATDLLVLCREPNRLASLAGRIGHYGKYSWLLLPTGGQRDVLRGNWPVKGTHLVADLGS